jgi:hypothetical protein
MRARWSRLAWPAGFAVAGVALFLLYLFQSSRTTTVNSDGASNALQGWAMLHGNVLLHGWTVSDVSFNTTELPQYALVEAIRGLSPGVVHICGAMTYTLLVLLAGALAMQRGAAGRRNLAAAVIAAGIMLAPQLGNPTDMLLLSPDHVGTGVPLLVAWLLVDRARQPDRAGEPDRAPGQANGRRWLVPVAVGLILAWTAVGDQLAEVIGALPLALTCAARVLWARFRGQVPLRDSWFELSLGAAAVLSVPAAWLGVKLISALGGWSISAPRSGLAAPGVLGRNVALTGSGILQLFGAGFGSQQTAAQTAFAVIHLIGLALAAWALYLAVRRFFSQQLLVQLLAVAIVVNVAAYIFTVQAESIATTREIAAVLPFGAVLAGRLLPETLFAGRPAHAPRRLSPGWVAAGVSLLACYLVMLGYNASQQPVPGQVANLASWLASHHLTYGLGGYWQSNSVTLDTKDAVQVRAIAMNGGKLTTAAYWEASSAWYDPDNAYANFIVNAPPAWHPDAPGVFVEQMEAIAGKPAKIYHIRGYTIAVWKQNLLSRLG